VTFASGSMNDTTSPAVTEKVDRTAYNALINHHIANKTPMYVAM